MNIPTLQLISKTKGLSQSDLARMSGVSRQAVSLWFKHPDGSGANLRSGTFWNLCQGLQVRMEELMEPLPCTEPATREPLMASLLWDRLYPDLEDFAIALARLEAKALARLVQSYGLFASEKIAGPAVWDRFPEYRNLILPVRREELERVWASCRNQTSN